MFFGLNLLFWLQLAVIPSGTDFEPPVYTTWRGSCVSFARTQNPNIPDYMFTLKQKKAAADPLALPLPGNTAVIDVGTKAGHLAAIEDVHLLTGEITVLDANWVKGKVTRRTGTMRELDIVGVIPRKTAEN